MSLYYLKPIFVSSTKYVIQASILENNQHRTEDSLRKSWLQRAFKPHDWCDSVSQEKTIDFNLSHFMCEYVSPFVSSCVSMSVKHSFVLNDKQK